MRNKIENSRIWLSGKCLCGEAVCIQTYRCTGCIIWPIGEVTQIHNCARYVENFVEQLCWFTSPIYFMKFKRMALLLTPFRGLRGYSGLTASGVKMWDLSVSRLSALHQSCGYNSYPLSSHPSSVLRDFLLSQKASQRISVNLCS